MREVESLWVLKWSRICHSKMCIFSMWIILSCSTPISKVHLNFSFDQLTHNLSEKGIPGNTVSTFPGVYSRKRPQLTFWPWLALCCAFVLSTLLTCRLHFGCNLWHYLGWHCTCPCGGWGASSLVLQTWNGFESYWDT